MYDLYFFMLGQINVITAKFLDIKESTCDWQAVAFNCKECNKYFSTVPTGFSCAVRNSTFKWCLFYNGEGVGALEGGGMLGV